MFTFLETGVIFAMDNTQYGNSIRLFDTILTEEVLSFLKSQDMGARQKILYNIRKAEIVQDSELFKKLTDEIWEFRTLWRNVHYRLFAFWDKEEGKVVVVTHGVVKKTSKIPAKELKRAIEIRNEYFRGKKEQKHEML